MVDICLLAIVLDKVEVDLACIEVHTELVLPNHLAHILQVIKDVDTQRVIEQAQGNLEVHTEGANTDLEDSKVAGLQELDNLGVARIAKVLLGEANDAEVVG